MWSDLLTNLERVADHCSNIAICVIDASHNNMNIHESVDKTSEEFKEKYKEYIMKYNI